MKDLTQGSTRKIIISMAVPVAAGMIFQTLYLLVDLYFVAALGEDSVAGVGTAGTLLFMIMALTQVLGVSAVALISQAVGRKDQDEANLIFNQSLILSGIFALITLVGGYLFARPYLATIAADEASLEEGVIFLKWFLPGMALQFAMMAMASSLRATGIVKPAMIVQVITVVLNTILAPVLIAGWGPGPALGVMGAGLASTISITVGVLMLALYFFKFEKYVSFNTKLWRPRFDIWRRMLDIGLPAGGEMLLLFVYFSVVYWLIQDFGASAQAGFSIGGRIMQSIFMPTMAIAFAVGPIIGQNFGAGLSSRVRETCYNGMMLSTAVMFVTTIFMQWQPELMVAFFTDDPEVIAVGAVFLQLISLNFIAQGIVFTASGVFQGLGNTRPALMSSGVRLLIFIPTAVYFKNQPDFAINQVWYISIVSVTVQAIVSFLLVRREFAAKLSKDDVEQATPA
ncbi:MAG: MATE family efflux transporter [SAR86 cluster bacterium]|uniref:Multidrug-efflux transporter n=1 Tax=SAR86 cluster bacterium TaxID=2030880 RepID=A0A2A5AWA2_9GAMM|nr:MAG: MATE family efflux transporter [SAR86 cluster bacterium]